MENKLTFEQILEALPTYFEKISRIEKFVLEYPEMLSSHPVKERYIPISQASSILHLAVPTIYSKVSRGQLPGVSKVGKRLLFDREALIIFISQNERKTGKQVLAEAMDRMAEINKKRII